MSLMIMSTRRALPLAAFALAALLAPTSPAQQSDNAKTSQTVTLPLVVHDKKGALVTSLQKGDLTLTQDNRPQTIQSLERSTEPLRIGLIIDTSRSMSGAQESDRKAAEALLTQLMPDGSKNQAFLIHFDREVELLQDFTSSRQKLIDELDQMGSTANRHDDQGPETTTDDRGDDRARRRGSPQLYDAIYLASDELMKGKDGRKVLIVFSNGADHGSKETMNDAVDAADRAGLAIYTIFFKGEQERGYGSSNFPTGGRRGGGYPGGGGGWPGSGGGGNRRQPEPTSATGIDGKKIMKEIADRTGGHAYEAKHSGDFEPIYKLIGEELGSTFVLTYTPDKPDNDGNFHKLAVTTNDKDWTISVPEGYYAPEK